MEPPAQFLNLRKHFADADYFKDEDFKKIL
jgi:hypothetical protein